MVTEGAWPESKPLELKCKWGGLRTAEQDYLFFLHFGAPFLFSRALIVQLLIEENHMLRRAEDQRCLV